MKFAFALRGMISNCAKLADNSKLTARDKWAKLTPHCKRM